MPQLLATQKNLRKSMLLLASLCLFTGIGVTACSKHEGEGKEGKAEFRTEEVAAKQGEAARAAVPVQPAKEPAKFVAPTSSAASTTSTTTTASVSAPAKTVTKTADIKSDTKADTKTQKAPATAKADSKDGAKPTDAAKQDTSSKEAKTVIVKKETTKVTTSKEEK